MKKEKLLVIVLSLSLVGTSFIAGILWQKTRSSTSKKAEESQNQPTPPSSPAQKIKPVDDSDHIRGSKNAPLTIIEYSDLECPFCKKLHPMMLQAMKDYPNKIRWVYRHFPIDQLHPKARKEAEAAECAALLGGEETFWKYIDKIFEITPSNNRLDLEKLPEIAQQIGIETQKFKNCLDEGKTAKRVQEDYLEGGNAGIRGTPALIFINEKGERRFFGGAPRDYEYLKQIIETMVR